MNIIKSRASKLTKSTKKIAFSCYAIKMLSVEALKGSGQLKQCTKSSSTNVRSFSNMMSSQVLAPLTSYENFEQ